MVYLSIGRARRREREVLVPVLPGLLAERAFGEAGGVVARAAGRRRRERLAGLARGEVSFARGLSIQTVSLRLGRVK